MLKNEIEGIASTPRDLRKFGLTLGIFFGAIGAYAAYRGGAHAVYFLAAGGVFIFFGMAWPRALKGVQKIWMTLALLMGWVMSRVILSVLFYAVLTPIGLLMRLAGKDLLDIKPGVPRSSYWKTHKARDKKDYEYQY